MADRIITCPECGVRLRIKEADETRKVRCPKCVKEMTVRPNREKAPEWDEPGVSRVSRLQKLEMAELADERPERSQRRKKQNNTLLIVGLLAGFGMIACVLVVALVLVLRIIDKDSAPPRANDAQAAVKPDIATNPDQQPAAPSSQPVADTPKPKASFPPRRRPGQPTNAPGAVSNPGQMTNPGMVRNPSQSVNPGVVRNPGQTANPGMVRNPRRTVNPGMVRNPGQMTSPPQMVVNPAVLQNISDSALPSIAVVNGKHGHGSGFIILPNVVMTNAHVVRDELLEDVSVLFISRNGAESEPLKVSLLWEDKNRDLALLHMATDTDRKSLELSTNFEPGPGKQVFIIGSPAQGGGISNINTVAAGSSSTLIMLRSRPFYQIDVATSQDRIAVGPGNSGGPVLDPSGRVVGVLSAGMMQKGRPIGKFFCIPLPALKTAIDGLGPAEGWAEKSKAAADRHVLDIAIVHVYLDIKMARVILDLRSKIAKDRNKFNAASVQTRDEKVITFFKELIKQSRELSEPAFNALSAGQDMAGVKNELTTMQHDLDQIYQTTIKPRVPPAEYKKVCQSVDNCDAAFRRLRKQTGLSDDIVDEMLDSLTDEVIATSVKNLP